MAKPEPKTPATESAGGTPPTTRSGDVQKGLTAIFRTEKGEDADLTTFKRYRNSRLVWALIGAGTFLVILTVAAWIGFLVFNPLRGFKGQGFQVTLDGPQRISLGQETTYFINWENTAAEPLADAQIRVSFPSDFTMTDTDPKPNGDADTWQLGAVPYGGRGTITVKGIFTGALGTQTAIQAVGTYRPASYNSDFETLATRSIEYADSVLSGQISAPQTSLSGDHVTISYNLQNQGTDVLKALQAHLTLPNGFVVDASSTAQISGQVATLPIGDLAAGASTTVSVSGDFASGVSGDEAIHAEAGHLADDGTFQAAQSSDATMTVLAGDLTLNLIANGSTSDRAIGFGDMLHFTIGYENTASEDLKNVSIQFQLTPVTASGTPVAVPVTVSKTSAMPVVVDWSQLDDAASGTQSGNMLSWDKNAVGVLERLTPLTDGSIDFSVPASQFASSTAVAFQATVQATVESVGDSVVDRTIKTAPITFTFRTDADVAASARYFAADGSQLGSGPLPPVVGQNTSYQIQWTLTKHLHELQDVQVSAVLPQEVTWPDTETASAGNVTYDEPSRTVTWTLNKLPSDVNQATADFTVQLTPSQDDVGAFADLFGETKFQATDADISQPVVVTKPGLTTNLQNDPGAKNKGVVKQP